VTAMSATPGANAPAVAAARGRRPRSGFWAAAFAFLIVMAVAMILLRTATLGARASRLPALEPALS